MMSEPIEMIRGNERQTVYGPNRAASLQAEGWQKVRDLSPEEQQRLADLPPMPWVGYDDMSVSDVLAKAEGLPPERIKEIVTYESATKGRVSVVDKLLGRQPAKATKPAATPAKSIEKQLEAETGHDVVRTGNQPPTFAETDAPAPNA
jgi:hypothetical protein